MSSLVEKFSAFLFDEIVQTLSPTTRVFSPLCEIWRLSDLTDVATPPPER